MSQGRGDLGPGSYSLLWFLHSKSRFKRLRLSLQYKTCVHGEGERAYIGYAPHYIFALKKSVFADVDNCLGHFAEFRCPLCRISMPTLPKKIRQNGQGRDTLPNSAKWVSANCPIFSTRAVLISSHKEL